MLIDWLIDKECSDKGGLPHRTRGCCLSGQGGVVSADKGVLSHRTRGSCLSGQGGVVSWDKGGLSHPQGIFGGGT